MTKRILPKIEVSALTFDDRSTFEPEPIALEQWKPLAAKDDKDDDRIININQEIGQRWDGSGITLSLIQGRLKKMGSGGVTVNINSPGGSYFEGLAIYNALREFDGEVTARVLGVAASAASVIAMASDELQVAKAGFLMVHNSWGMALGNRHDMRKVAEDLSENDRIMAGIYHDRTGLSMDEIRGFMDNETFFSGEQAVELGFADGLLDSDKVETVDEGEGEASLRRLELALARDGMSRSERRSLLSDLFSDTPRAVQAVTPCADGTVKPCADDINNALKTFFN